MNIMFSEPEHREKIIALAKVAPAVKDFTFTWESWHNWEKYPPVIAVNSVGTVCGFWAFTYSKKRKYINTYYHTVYFIFRRQGVSSSMLEFILQNCDAERMKLKTHFGGEGEKFWRGLGFQPFARNKDEFVWDFDIRNCKSIAEIVEWNKHPELHQPIPDSEMKKYRELELL